MNAGRLALGVVVACATALPAQALETDQFYAWVRPLSDATDAINAEINAGIEDVLLRANARRRPGSCDDIRESIHERFHYVIISRFELWAMHTARVERAPAGDDEASRYSRAWLYGETAPLDHIRWMPPSPTIEVAGVRIGADKLGHFLSDGASAEKRYRRALAHGASEADAVMSAMRFGVTEERTIMGLSSSGIFSPADLEADFQGLMFYRGLCEGAEPRLARTPGGWRLERPLDLREFVTPEWDESWQPNVYTPSRWAKVKLVMRRYCDLLHDPGIERRRAAYAARDSETTVEALVRSLVAEGSLDDPAQFAIDAACGFDAPSP